MYRKLDVAKVADTARLLERRIRERFPDSGLSRVCDDLRDLIDETERRGKWIREPKWWLRISVGLVVLLIAVALVETLRSLGPLHAHFTLGELVTVTESGLNELVLIGVAIVFLISVETRIKRNRALHALRDFRGVAHVIDMHQLTKDPERAHAEGGNTESSPERTLTPFLLARYLDYCSEMLSLVGKAAALYMQYLDDPVVSASVQEIENLTSSLSLKIWQKIQILQASQGSRENPDGAPSETVEPAPSRES